MTVTARIRWGEYIPLGYVPMARAALCGDCSALFVLDTICPNCAGTDIMPLATWLDRVRVKEEA